MKRSTQFALFQQGEDLPLLTGVPDEAQDQSYDPACDQPEPDPDQEAFDFQG